MKNTSKIIAPWAVAAISLGLANGVWADDINNSSPNPSAAGREQTSGAEQMTAPTTNYNQGYNQGSTMSQTSDQGSQTSGSYQGSQPSGSQASTYQGSQSTSASAGAPTDANKASGFVGMDVRNQNGEHLGHIQDLVFDLNSQRISYAVLSTAPKGLPFVNEKLLAVPLNAFTIGPDEKYLILRADKSQLETASGIEKNNWPSVNNPSWGAQPFWQNNNTGGTMNQQNQPSTPTQQP